MRASTVSLQMTVLGTPAEEGLGGKLYLIEDDALSSVDFSLMAHPWAVSCVAIPGFLSRVK